MRVRRALSGNLTVYVEAAHDAYRRLVPSSYPPLSPSPSPSVERFSPYAPPTLLVITAEPDIPLRLRRDVALADPWDIVQSPAVEVRAEGEGVERLREEGPEAGAAGRSKAYAAGVAAGGASGSDKDKMVKVVVSPNNNNNNKKKPAAARRLTRTRTRRAAPATLTLDVGYTQQAFNALPLLERVAHTQAFVRDLTVLVNEADAAVVSGASNVGRLAMLCVGASRAQDSPRNFERVGSLTFSLSLGFLRVGLQDCRRGRGDGSSRPVNGQASRRPDVRPHPVPSVAQLASLSDHTRTLATQPLGRRALVPDRVLVGRVQEGRGRRGPRECGVCAGGTAPRRG